MWSHETLLLCFYVAGDDVIIDDRFPVHKDAYWDVEDKKVYGGGGLDLPKKRLGAPKFLASRSHNEFWASMLEKALAKYYGAYSNIEGGFVHLAMYVSTCLFRSSMHLTDVLVPFRCDMIPGSVGQDIDMTKSKADIASGKLWSSLLRFYNQGFLLGAGSPSGLDTEISSMVWQHCHLRSFMGNLKVSHVSVLSEFSGSCAGPRLQHPKGS